MNGMLVGLKPKVSSAQIDPIDTRMAIEKVLTPTKQTKIDQCERARVN
jgi:hypothetical protein